MCAHGCVFRTINKSTLQRAFSQSSLDEVRRDYDNTYSHSQLCSVITKIETPQQSHCDKVMFSKGLNFDFGKCIGPLCELRVMILSP